MFSKVQPTGRKRAGACRTCFFRPDSPTIKSIGGSFSPTAFNTGLLGRRGFGSLKDHAVRMGALTKMRTFGWCRRIGPCVTRILFGCPDQMRPHLPTMF